MGDLAATFSLQSFAAPGNLRAKWRGVGQPPPTPQQFSLESAVFWSDIRSMEDPLSTRDDEHTPGPVSVTFATANVRTLHPRSDEEESTATRRMELAQSVAAERLLIVGVQESRCS